jgi:hypothetical protein
VANQAAALELSRKSRRGNVALGIGKCWLCYLDGGRWTLLEFVMNVKQFKDWELGEDFERRNKKNWDYHVFGRAKQISGQTGLLERLKIDITLARDKIYLRVLM